MTTKSKIKCYMLEETDRVARWLRRYDSAMEIGVRLCEPWGFHNAAVRIEDGALLREPDQIIYTEPMDWFPDDPRWPEKCAYCDYQFKGYQGGQLFFLPIYLDSDGTEVVAHVGLEFPGIAKAPPGSMWYNYWAAENMDFRGPDGQCLCVMTPGGEWQIDGMAKNGIRPWKRTGVPPKVTVKPSIWFPEIYHAKLENGVLIEV